IVRADDVVTLQIEPGNRSEIWKLLSRDAGDLAAQRNIYEDFPTLVDLDRSSQVTIAIPLHASQGDGRLYAFLPTEDRKRVVWGKSVSVRVDLGGRRNIK